MADMYEAGRGVEADFDKALELYQKALDAGYKGVYEKIGDHYRDKENNIEKALEWYQKGYDEGYLWFERKMEELPGNTVFETKKEKAEQGDPEAQYYVANAYLDGKLVGQDIAEAVKWLEKAAGSENADAAYRLARMYDTGDAGEKNTEKALAYYLQAAEAGKASAYERLGYHYLYGDGVEQDIEKAADFYRQASEIDHSYSAYFPIGQWYEDAQNMEKAMEWYQKGIDNGDVECRDRMNQLR